MIHPLLEEGAWVRSSFSTNSRNSPSTTVHEEEFYPRPLDLGQSGDAIEDTDPPKNSGRVAPLTLAPAEASFALRFADPGW
jgi:hypothetical protein